MLPQLKKFFLPAVLLMTISLEKSYGKGVGFYEIQTGWGSFKDLQLPYFGDEFNAPGPYRADGVSISTDSGTHYGFPIDLNITYRWFEANYGVDLSLGVMFLKHLYGDEEATFSSFQSSNVTIKPFSKGYFLKVPRRIGGVIQYKRNDYFNVGSGHSISGLMVGGFLQVGSLKKIRVEVQATKNVSSEFSYSSGSYFDSPKFDGQESRQHNIKFGLSKHLGSRIIGLVNFEMDSVDVKINDINSYEKFGFVISPYQPTSKSYNLDSQILSFGLRKLF